MTFPKMFRVKQELEGPMLSDIPGAVRDTIRSLRLQDKVKAGQSIAITAGSRGVANIARITRAVVDETKALGLKPALRRRFGRRRMRARMGLAWVLHFDTRRGAP